MTIAELGLHILRCDRVSLEDLLRFQTALAEFSENPVRAREVAEAWISRIQWPEGE